MRLLLTLCFGLVSLIAPAQFNSENLALEQDARVVTKYTLDKLRVYPIRANETFRSELKDVGSYNNLEKAIKGKKVKITEVSESGTVNTLYAKNVSKDPIYIMAGEVVKGGKQDRIIGQDIVLAPGESKNLAAFCVEQGRWSQKSSGSRFTGYMNVSSNSIRKQAVINKNQSAVWEEVEEVVTAYGAKSDTGAYTELENSEEYNKEIEKYLKHFSGAWRNDPTIVGVVAVTEDRIIGCDIFATHELFVNAYDNLIHAYVTEAITDGDKVTITPTKVQKYLDQFLANEADQEKKLEGKGAVFKHKGKKLHVSKF